MSALPPYAVQLVMAAKGQERTHPVHKKKDHLVAVSPNLMWVSSSVLAKSPH
jgi:hypothetical protein